MTPITVPHTNSLLKTYRMMYWSQGTKTAAYVAAPEKPGSYKFFVSCHGGYIVPLKQSHLVAFSTPEQSAILMNQNLLEKAPPGIITLLPMYQGYDTSEGTIHDLNSDTIDTENGIKAVKSYFNSNTKLPNIEEGMIWLEGESLGGGVALKLASERHDITSLVAISPFVGWDIYGNFLKKHQKISTDKNTLESAIQAYGPFDPKSKAYQQESIDYSKINTPVLLMQGTADKVVPWQTVQTLYKKMKADHQNVTFDLIKGGNHGLTNKKAEMTAILNK